MSKFKKHSLLILLAMLLLLAVPISFASDITADNVGIADNSSDIIQYSDLDTLSDADNGFSVENNNIEIDEGQPATITGTIVADGMDYYGELNFKYSYVDANGVTQSENVHFNAFDDTEFTITIADLTAANSPYTVTLSVIDDDLYEEFSMYGNPIDDELITITVIGTNAPIEDPALPEYTTLTPAGQLYVDDSEGNDDNDGSQATPYKTIQKALDQNKALGGSYEVIVNAGTYNVSGYSISNSVRITGRGKVIIDAQENGYHFSVGGTTVEFNNLTFINGKNSQSVGSLSGSSTYGASGNSEKVLNIVNCTFENNYGQIGVLRTYATTTIINSNFVNNEATGTSTGFGNIIYGAENTLTVKFSNFIDNTVKSGKTTIDSVEKSNANYNFWGSNNGPSSSDVGEKVTAKTWVIIDATLDATTVTEGNEYAVNIKNKYVKGEETADLGIAMPNLDVTVNAEEGTIDPTTVTISNNLGETTYTAPKAVDDAITVKVNSNTLKTINVEDIVAAPAPVYSTVPSPASVEYTIGESSVVDVTASYVSSDEDYWSGLDLTGSNMYVYVNGTGVMIGDVDSDAKSFSVDLKDIDYDFVAGETYSLVFHAPNGILSYANVDLADCEFTPLTVTVKSAPEPEYLYVSTPSPASVDYVKGESCLVTFVLEYPDGYDLDYVPIEIFFDGSFFGEELEDVDNYAKSVTIDLKDFDDMFTAGETHTVIVRHVNDIMDYNDIGAADRLLNELTVNVKAAEPVSDAVYETTPLVDGSASVDYTKGDSCIVTVTVAHSQYLDLEDDVMGTMRVYINDDEFVAIDGADGVEEFTFDLASISDKLSVGVYNLTFHPNPGSIMVGDEDDYVFNVLTVNVTDSSEPEVYSGIIYVDVEGNDANVGSSDKPVATIAKAIELASADNNTEHKIVIREGTYKENNLNITSGLDIAGEGNVVIDAEKLNRILNINTTADVNVSGITFKNGKASSAGAISIKDAKATIDNCVFTENDASSGAAIVIDADNVKLTNDVFTNNTGRNGAVKVGVYSWSARKSTGSNSVIENCTFDNNHNSIYGNCIGLDIEEATTGIKIIGSNFTNNKGEVYSEHGALYIKGDDVVVDGCLFENNSMGMAAAVQIDGENAVIKNSKFINNTVNTGLVTRSGAIEVQNAATITGNTFINNGGDDCVQGGAIDIVYAEYGGDIVISDNEFINNTAAKGAAIYVDGGSEDGCEFDSLTIENNVFDGNKAEQGAGIYTATSTTSIDIKNNEFTKNTAEEGSAIFAENTFINLESNTMDDEEIYLDGYSEIDSETTLTFDAPSQAVKGETVNVTARLTDDMNNSVSGVSVKFTANGNDIGEAITENGVATVEFTVDDAIEYLISGEADLDATIKTATINGILNATIDIPDVIGVAGEKVTVPVVVKVDGENVTDGNVSVIFNNETIEVPINNGIANVELTLPKQAGNYDLIVSYGGNNETKLVNVSEAPVKLASVFSITLVSGYNVSATLIDAYGNAIPYATVDYMIGDVSNSTVTGADGSFTIVGNGDVITMSYAGNVTYLATNTSIKFDNAASTRLATQFNVTNGFRLQVYAVDYKAGERGAFFDVLLTDSNGNPLVNQTVFFAINGWVHNKTTDANGVARLQINLQDANYYTCAPCYLGNTTYNATFASAMLDVIKKPITISAAAKSYKATAKTKKYTVTLKTIKGSSADGKTYLKSGKKVTLKVNGKTYTAKINAKGQATFSLKITKKGKFQAVIKFAGDKTYNSASKKVTITIK